MIDEKQYYASQTVEIEDEKVRNAELITQGAGVAAGYGGYRALSYFADTEIGQRFLQNKTMTIRTNLNSIQTPCMAISCGIVVAN